jgi:hypothetical protein
MLTESKRRLQAFVALVEQIESYSYFRGGGNIAGATIRPAECGHWSVDFHGPPDEPTDAVAFRVRLLTHSDDLSMRRMGELFEDSGVSDEWREAYEACAGALRRRMSETWAEGPRGILSFRDAFEMELHGHRGHHRAADPAFQNYQLWITNDFERENLKNTFHQILIWVVAAAHNLAIACRRELAR